jgi:branched-subunit amino acid aminotransferase/4-amino-4-deoxychorismate lyase
VVQANKHEACYLRPIAFYGSEKMGVSPVGAKVHVAIAAWPWGAYLGPDALAKGIRVKTSSYARHQVNVTMARAKMSGTYPELGARHARSDAARLRRGPAARRRRLRRPKAPVRIFSW